LPVFLSSLFHLSALFSFLFAHPSTGTLGSKVARHY
jgi:hypothetical protein